MKKEHKEKVEKTVKNIEQGMNKLDQTVQKNVSPKIKGLELPLILTLVFMVLVGGLSVKSVILGSLLFLVTSSPVLLPKLMKSKPEKKKSEKQEKTDSKKDS